MTNSVRPPPARREAFVERILDYAMDDTHGYSQRPPSGRWGPDYDCSSLIYQAASDVGYPVGTGRDKVRFTGTMLKDFEKAGFQILPFANVGVSDLEIGDILLNLALHAEVYVGEGQTVGATSSEDGGYVGESGDQTGHEIEKHPVATFDKGWDYVLRPPNEEEQEDEAEVPMNYGPMQGGQQGWPNPAYPQGYPQGGVGSHPWPQGYPQGNLGQMNGYSQAGTGYPQGGYQQQNGYPQGGYPQGGSMPTGPQGGGDLPFVMGIEGARSYRGMPNGRMALFDEDKPIMYIVEFDQQGNANNINVYAFEECSEDMPQHLSPLMNRTTAGGQGGTGSIGQFVTRDEFERLREELLGNAEPSSQEPASRASGSKSTRSRANASTA